MGLGDVVQGSRQRIAAGRAVVEAQGQGEQLPADVLLDVDQHTAQAPVDQVVLPEERDRHHHHHEETDQDDLPQALHDLIDQGACAGPPRRPRGPSAPPPRPEPGPWARPCRRAGTHDGIRLDVTSASRTTWEGTSTRSRNGLVR